MNQAYGALGRLGDDATRRSRPARHAAAQVVGIQDSLNPLFGKQITDAPGRRDLPEPTAASPTSCKALAKMLHMGLPIRCVALDGNGGYDTHENQAATLTNNLTQFAGGAAGLPGRPRGPRRDRRQAARRPRARPRLERVRAAPGRERLGHRPRRGGRVAADGRHERDRQGMEGEFTGVTTLDQQQNLRNSTDFRSVYKTLLEDWLGGDLGRRAAERRAVLEPRADQGLVAAPRAWSASLRPARRSPCAAAPAAAPGGARRRARSARAAARAGSPASAPRPARALDARRTAARDRRPRAAAGHERPRAAHRRARRGSRARAAAAAASAGRRPALRAGHVARLRPGRAAARPVARRAVLAGSVGVEFNNKYAEDPHDLRIRAGSTTYAFDEVAAGAAPRRSRSTSRRAPGSCGATSPTTSSAGWSPNSRS